jgi:hypothetical protein
LGVTCDNASPNDTTIKELKTFIQEFPGEANQMWCFNHIITIVGMRMVWQFDVTGGDGTDVMDDEL